jgi:hypothetical protein
MRKAIVQSLAASVGDKPVFAQSLDFRGIASKQFPKSRRYAGRNRGHWPGSPEIAAAMFEDYHKKSTGNEPKQ